jgi:hypothetical protein
MRYRLNKLIYGPVGGVQIEFLDRGPTWFDAGNAGDVDAGELKVSYLRGELAFTKTDENVLVSGTVDTAVDAQCVRSLEFFSLPLEIVLDNIPYSLPDRITFAESEDEPDRRISSDSWIDLTEMLREEIILAIPINPISPKYAGANPTALPDALAEDDDWVHVTWSDPAAGEVPRRTQSNPGPEDEPDD